MATRTRKKAAPKTTTKAAAKPSEKDECCKGTVLKSEFSPDRRITVNVGTCAEYGKAKVGISLSQNIKDSDDEMELCDAIFNTLSEKLQEQFEKLCESLELDDEVEEVEDEEEVEEVEDEEEVEEDEEEVEEDDEEVEEDEDYTEDDIKAMKKPELLSLIKDEELEVDVKGLKLADLRSAVCDAYFGEEEEEEEEEAEDDGEWDDDDWGDDED